MITSIQKVWLYYRKLTVCFRPTPKLHRVVDPRTIKWGSEHGRALGMGIPKTIWTYWEGKKSPTVEACFNNWHLHCPNYDIRILEQSDIYNYLPDFPPLSRHLPPQKISNLVRLMLLEKYGGIWMDGSILLTQSLDWLIDLAQRDGSDTLAFYNEFIEEYEPDHNRPIIENGLIVSTPDSSFITSWRKEYQRCIASSDYENYYPAMTNFNNLTKLFKNKDRLSYFVCYIAAQQVMTESHLHALTLINAEDEYYFDYYKKNTRNSNIQLAQDIALKGKYPIPARIIKLHAGHRSLTDSCIKNNFVHRSSLLSKYALYYQNQLAQNFSD